jgi:hypothetical protein
MLQKVEIEALSIIYSPWSKVKRILRDNFNIKDYLAVDIIMAAAVSHYVTGEPLWLRYYGASRAGRTELLRAFRGHSDIADLDFATPASISGGFREGHLTLSRLNGKLVITSDLSSFYGLRPKEQKRLWALLRRVKDGSLVTDYNIDERDELRQEARFDWILSTTEEMLRENRQLDALLGSRFVDLMWHSGDRLEAGKQAQVNQPLLESKIRPELKEAVHEVMDKAKALVTLQQVNPVVDDYFAEVANVVTQLQYQVKRDRYSKAILGIPATPYPTEMTQNFSKIATGFELLSRIDGTPYDYKPYIIRLAYGGCVNRCVKRIKQRRAPPPA